MPNSSLRYRFSAMLSCACTSKHQMSLAAMAPVHGKNIGTNRRHKMPACNLDAVASASEIGARRSCGSHLGGRLHEGHQGGVADAVHLVAAKAALVLALRDQQ